MKPATEKQVRARQGHGCLLTSEDHGCGESPEVVIQGLEGTRIKVRLCAVHEKRLKGIIEDARKAHRRQRWAA